MRSLIWIWIVCLAIAQAGIASAGPAARPRTKYQAAVQLVNAGDYEKALVAIEDALAGAPNDPAFLFLKGQVLVKLRDYAGALAAYEADLAAGATGATRREAEKIVGRLGVVTTTFLDITVANGPATIYLDSRTLGVLCTAAPSCSKPMLPGDYKVIAERAGFVVWSAGVTVAASATAKLDITLVEKPSPVTVRVVPAGAQVTIDGTAYDGSSQLAAGSHQVIASLAGHVAARQQVEAHEGKPIDLDLALARLVPVRVTPSAAALALDGKPVVIEDGGMAVPPGEHVLVVRANGYREQTVKVPAERAADYQIAVELARIPAVVAVAPASRFTRMRKLALGAGGVGLVAAAAGAVLGVQSKQHKDDAFALCPSPSSPCSQAREADAAYRSGRTSALRADIAFGVAGAAAIAAAVLWFTGAPESQVAVTPRVGAVAGLDLAVRF
jgi:hypothetical protein